jgi:hypothetical protein
MALLLYTQSSSFVSRLLLVPFRIIVMMSSQKLIFFLLTILVLIVFVGGVLIILVSVTSILVFEQIFMLPKFYFLLITVTRVLLVIDKTWQGLTRARTWMITEEDRILLVVLILLLELIIIRTIFLKNSFLIRNE